MTVPRVDVDGQEPDLEPTACQKEVFNQQAAEHADDNHLPMDHGLNAWLQVLGCWILFANTW